MIQTQGSRDVFYGNGFARQFTLSFPAPDPPAGKQYVFLIISDADGKNPVPVLSNFALARHGETISVTYPVSGDPPAQGKKLTVYRQLPLTQPTDLANGGNFYPETIEDTFDWLEMQIQQLDEASARAIKVPVSSDQTPEDLLADIFDARDTAATKAAEAAASRDAAAVCRDEACECAAAAEITLQEVLEAADRSCACAASAEHSAETAVKARDACIRQAMAIGDLLAADAVERKVFPPCVSSPADEAEGVGLLPQIALSAFACTEDLDIPIGTSIVISDASDFSNVVDAYSGVYTTTWTPSVQLALGATHYVRARHLGAKFSWSEWSETVSFTTLAYFLQTPGITAPAGGAIVKTLTPAITFAAPVVAGQTVTHKQAQVSTSSTFATIAWDSGEVAYGNTNSITSGALARNTTYYVRVRLKGSRSGRTDWSAPVCFSVATAVPNDVWNFASSGSFTVPVAGVYTLEVSGGGGGGVSYSGPTIQWCYSSQNGTLTASGGYGGYGMVSVSLAAGTVLSVVVGAGGAKAVGGGDTLSSSAGGTSGIGNYVSGTGGGGGTVWAVIYDSCSTEGYYVYEYYRHWHTADGAAGSGSSGSGTGVSGGSGNQNGTAGYARITLTSS